MIQKHAFGKERVWDLVDSNFIWTALGSFEENL